jgi:dipeptidyl aminopeptidase/acylaminoacyl peptidase
MPWDGTELWTGVIEADGSISQPQKVAGGLSESIYQPEWSPDGLLYFVSDRTDGWWNLHRWHKGQLEAVTNLPAEFGQPQWVFGLTTYGFQSAEQLICAYTQNGHRTLARLDTASLQLEPFDLPYDDIDEVLVGSTFAVFKAGSSTTSAAIVRLDLKSGRLESLRQSDQAEVDQGYLSKPQAIEFPTEGGLTAHAFYYPPHNQDFAAPAGEKPPLLVCSHGGPTGATSTTFDLELQYWTSRGIAVVDVNYGGSTGYGRAYRDRLKGQWGVVDLDDCANAARYLVAQGLADPQRLAIRGGSAGGYTTLAVLTFRDVFQAGASYYGVSDLAGLALETHKFESRYLDQLIGPYPEAKAIYEARSPIHHVDQLNRPIIFFQGLEDKVVPPNQAELLVDALRRKGVPVAYLPYEGEQHGFRRAENIKRSLDAELYFYSSMFDFSLADPVEPVQIENF